mmetsp:Transcript_10881/g.23328  ORF Transcript_10881/g.23328 Transcript_10881/m.23328 type:complete len:127 (-) Transcript_10881:138-518(-)
MVPPLISHRRLLLLLVPSFPRHFHLLRLLLELFLSEVPLLEVLLSELLSRPLRSPPPHSTQHSTDCTFREALCLDRLLQLPQLLSLHIDKNYKCNLSGEIYQLSVLKQQVMLPIDLQGSTFADKSC